MHYETDQEEFIRKECAAARSFSELAEVAIRELRKFPAGCEIVCGPISTGGRGSLEANFRVFEASVARLLRESRPIFSQIPYEERIVYLRNQWLAEDPAREGQYCMPILTELYLPLIKRRIIKRAWFIPGWQSSFGTKWEREQLTLHGVEITDLTDEWVDEALANTQG